VIKQGGLVFLFTQDCQNSFRSVQKQWPAPGFSPCHGDPTENAWRPIRITAFSSFHLPATITHLTAAAALGQAKGARKRSLPRPREEKISLAHYRSVCELSELHLFPDYRAHHAVLMLLLSPYPAPCTGGARLGRLVVGRSSHFAGGVALWVQSELTPT